MTLGEALRQKMVDQDFACPYTGERLVLGVNASLDHIMPVARYPELARNPANVEWVDQTVNFLKRDRTPDEFLGIVGAIAHHRGL